MGNWTELRIHKHDYDEFLQIVDEWNETAKFDWFISIYETEYAQNFVVRLGGKFLPILIEKGARIGEAIKYDNNHYATILIDQWDANSHFNRELYHRYDLDNGFEDVGGISATTQKLIKKLKALTPKEPTQYVDGSSWIKYPLLNEAEILKGKIEEGIERAKDKFQQANKLEEEAKAIRERAWHDNMINKVNIGLYFKEMGYTGCDGCNKTDISCFNNGVKNCLLYVYPRKTIEKVMRNPETATDEDFEILEKVDSLALLIKKGIIVEE